MKRILTACSLLCLLLVTGCVGMPGTNTGALVGGVAGAALSRDNPIAGAIIGGVGGALIGNMIDNSGGSGYRGNRGSYSNPGYNDRAYYERMERQRAYEEQMQWRRLQQQRQWGQQRYYGGRGCYRC
ncbi:MAG: glycine zipper 2TM domain-containing protein [Candidatus Obscuribacter sp.]|jgi:hypothetical protein|nr:glycine zipper 2TM domain-containing protein [Candidatus Obscuribacter sp.]MBK9621537.1 glycine zipper 2TM domain-containing protein [Candidatus Obscuribacter sp.]MBL0186130.1 glycine zipper 2TM domain-containing protein [Candidatus Obscuribacter sp.]MBP6350948.1 glycine zipper 2TM domain-containing protein [Candidatus Obscuribacter sp.]MBP6594788.1 glycine zipper 2TM domain-containing protein [Candidatus Obscuribacter sp.]